MFNKVINKDKIVKALNEHESVTLVSSSGNRIATIFYDGAYTKKGDVRFLMDAHPFEYFMSINLDKILMYDTNKKELIITF